MTRPSGRKDDEMRPVVIETGVSRHAEGSCLISMGHTRVICTASLQEGVPAWLKGLGRGWVTAEYGMLPRATGERMRREAKSGGQTGRTQEIQRLIGRSLRAVTDLEALGEHQIVIDCDVIQADGGTRCASITGGWVALRQCVDWMLARRIISRDPLRDHVAAISCGIHDGRVLLDLDYIEDSEAETDANFVMTGDGGLVEIQATAEERPFSEAQFLGMLELARKGVAALVRAQRAALAAEDGDGVEV
ncbi:MAG TPA: ribonuclease PH [Thermopetrobacter sp.]|nr:ribonuclease PH [Thermopetrobacter sp.]